MNQVFDDLAGKQLGEPARFAAAMLDLADAPTRPAHLLLGSDALAAPPASSTLKSQGSINGEKVTRGTDFPVKCSRSGAAPRAAEIPTTGKFMAAMPVWYIPHGAGPCFFMDPPQGAPDAWRSMEAYLRGLAAAAGARPRAIVVISAHWRESRPTATAAAAPALIYDYRGFPPQTYQLKYPAPGDPALAADIARRLAEAGIDAGLDEARGFDHGVFVPLMLVFPEADIPVVQLSMIGSLDPASHIAVGRALAPLRKEGVLIIGSGQSFHNLQNFYNADRRVLAVAEKFDAWLTAAVTSDPAARDAALPAWDEAPGAQFSHPYPDHLIPLMVAAGAAGEDRGVRDFSDHVFGAPISGYRFG